jgi:hypothetical protein
MRRLGLVLLVLAVIAIAVAFGVATMYWPSCGDVGAPWWCW